MEEDLIQQSLDDYDAGKYSPRLLTAHELPLDAHVLEPDEDQQRLQLSRQQLQVTGEGRAGETCPRAPGWGGGPGARTQRFPPCPPPVLGGRGGDTRRRCPRPGGPAVGDQVAAGRGG